MAEAVKSRRRYDSSRRREQAAATRRQILEAAQRLFQRQGYAATTMAEVAREAGVASKTVYLAFETKGGVLRALWNFLLRGDQEDVPIDRREWYRAVLEEPDPERQIRMGAASARAVKQRIGWMFEVIRAAAPIDPDIEALWKRIETEFHANQRVVVASIGAKDALAPGLDVDRATDILWTLNHPVVWQLLVIQRGWTPDEYERWLADAAVEQLLGKRST